MNATTATASAPARRRSNTAYRWVRQLHLWIGAWGALAAIVYGFTGLVMNHRFGDAAWPQGDSAEIGRVTLQVPEAARHTPEALSLWLRQSQSLDAQVIRKGSPGAREAKQPQKWTLSGGTASESWSLEYAPGKPGAELKRSSHTALAAFNRLHKGVGGGWAWILLADSFAIGMLLLGLSGIWMWGARTHADADGGQRVRDLDRGAGPRAGARAVLTGRSPHRQRRFVARALRCATACRGVPQAMACRWVRPWGLRAGQS